MATALKEFAIALGLLASDPAALGPKHGFAGYVWHVVDLERCTRIKAGECPLLLSKWDWKRPQSYKLSIVAGRASGGVQFVLDIDNQDRSDTDTVCFMMIVRTQSGKVQGAQFASLKAKSQHSLRTEVSIDLAPDVRLERLEIGSKQCDETRSRDQSVAARFISKL